MDIQKNFKLQKVLIFSSAVLVLVCISLSGFFALLQFKNADQAWRLHSQRATDIGNALGEVSLRIGYGGLIHNFKNLVLRRDLLRYEKQVEDDLDATQAAIDRLDGLLELPEDHAAVVKLRATVREYAQKYRLAVQLIHEGKSSADVDAVVKVSDTAALEALAFLVKRSNVRFAQAKQNAESVQKKATQLYVAGWLLTLVAVVGSVILIVFLSQSLRTNAGLLHDKQALLKEVHHRVKNNLQVISSLFRLEARRSDVPAVKSVLTTMRGRVHTMAKLHEALYRSGKLASVDLHAYLDTIARLAFDNQILPTQTVQLHVNLGSLQVSMDQAIACGLLVNELISNCLKHGFPQGHAGEVRVELHPASAAAPQTDALWCLRVSDTGVGLATDFESKRESSLGMQLVEDLSQQAGGTLSIDSAPGAGAVFSVVFAAQAPAPLIMPL